MAETISASLTASTETITASLTVADETITAELNTAARGPEGPAGSGGGGGGGDALVADPLSQFAATTSAQLAGVLTDETGTGSAVFATSPTLTSPVINTGVSGTAILDEDNLASDSDTQLATQQSIKAYVDDAIKAVTITAKVNEAGGITKGQVVFISGATGGFPQVSLADNTDFSKSDVLAVATETKTDGQNVAITIAGLVENIDTSAYTEGAVLYLGTSGNITETHPTGINAVERIGHAVKINASTGSILVELDGLTVINDHDGIMRHQIVNQNAGTSASAAYTLVNDAAYRASLSMVGSNYAVVAGISNSLIIYNEGYNKTVNAVDGNYGFEWWTDTTDSHNLTSTSKMSLSATGNLTVTGTIGGSNLSGTNTGDQDLSAYQLEPSEGGFVDGDKTKLDAIEASADVTDVTNVTAAGALMDSEVTNLAQVKAFDSTDYATAAHASDTANPHSVTATQVGLGNVDNTSDASKPVSTLTQTAINSVYSASILRANHTGTQTLATISDAGTAAASATGDFAPIAHASDTANPHAVTKAQVGLTSVDDTADADKPVSTATQTALDLVADNTTFIKNKAGLAPLYSVFQAANDPATNPYIGITRFGDSMCSQNYTSGYLFHRLEGIYGTGAILSPGLGDSWNGAAWTLAGGASKLVTDYDRFPGSNEINIPSGGSAEIVLPKGSTRLRRGSAGHFGLSESFLTTGENHFNMPKGVKTVTVIYMKESGAGTLGITIEQNGATDQTASVDCDVSEVLASSDFTPTNRAGGITVGLTATTAAVNVLGVVFWGDSGILNLSSYRGGSTMASQSASLSASTFGQPYKDLIALLGVSVVIHAQRAATETTPETYYEQFFDAYTDAGLHQVIFGEPSYAADQAAAVSINNYLEAEAISRGFAFYDRYAIATAATIAAEGWDDDAAHLDGMFHQYDSGVFLREVGEFHNGVNRFNRGISPGRLTDGLAFDSLGLTMMKQEVIRGAKGIETETASTSGGYSFSVNNERGFVATAASAVGYAAARIGFLAGGDNGGMEIAKNIIFTGTGYRNMNTPDDAKAWILFGTSSTTITTLTGLAQKVIGIEFQDESTIGESHLSAGENAMRIIACDGTTTTSSPWIEAEVSPAGANGLNFMLSLDNDTGHIFLHAGNTRLDNVTDSPRLLLSLPTPTMASNSLSGGWVQLGIESDTGTSTGGVSFKEIKMLQGGFGGQLFEG